MSLENVSLTEASDRKLPNYSFAKALIRFDEECDLPSVLT